MTVPRRSISIFGLTENMPQYVAAAARRPQPQILPGALTGEWNGPAGEVAHSVLRTVPGLEANVPAAVERPALNGGRGPRRTSRPAASWGGGNFTDQCGLVRAPQR